MVDFATNYNIKMDQTFSFQKISYINLILQEWLLNSYLKQFYTCQVWGRNDINFYSGCAFQHFTIDTRVNSTLSK